MGQYNRIKSKYPDAILLFRVGDFYETFSQDAVITAKVLGIVLTKRANGSASHIELAGFPHHALDTYLPKLVKAGYRVAICDQLEDPKTTKKIVKRGVTELITPGVAINDQILEHHTNNFLASVTYDKNGMGIAFLDISTGEFLVAEGNPEYIDKLLQGFNPSEILMPKNSVKKFHELFGDRYYIYPLDDWIFTTDFCRDKLLDHFQTVSLKGFGIEDSPYGIIAAGAALHYIESTEHPNLSHINHINQIPRDDYVWLDRFTIRNLELFHSSYETGVPLIKILDNTQTPMGGRLMKKWLMLPLKDPVAINHRLDSVEYLIKETELTETVQKQLRLIGDLERLISKVPLGKINPREILHIQRSLDAIEPVKEALSKTGADFLKQIGTQFNSCIEIRNLISSQIKDDAPTLAEKGNIFKDGIDKELDEWRDISRNGKQKLADLQQKEIEKTQIQSLKVGFNNVFGYYLEVTNRHKDKVPDEWVRKQTLVNAERYITAELKELEEKIMKAEDKIRERERGLYQDLVKTLGAYIQPVQNNAHQTGVLDCLMSFTHNAIKFHYRKPFINDSLAINITQGRHPVIEQQLETGDSYIPNDIYLDNSDQQIIVITGPNMSGKSALLRQTALICLMAQMGSFVPAQKAELGILDKIFTRVGASDNISLGESTFMVEMNETASIMNNITDRSLIIMDEIGRGTSTFDGISIAWSLAEFLHNNQKAAPKTLFATHYHELNELAEKFPRIRNFNVSTKEAGNKVLFLRKLVPGGSKHSFGIHVAKMAGMPNAVVDRANEILKLLEQKGMGQDIENSIQQIPESNFQLSIFQLDNPSHGEIIKSLKNLDVNSLTPVEALMKLNELKEKLDS